jgi:hypothetical protein
MVRALFIGPFGPFADASKASAHDNIFDKTAFRV